MNLQRILDGMLATLGDRECSTKEALDAAFSDMKRLVQDLPSQHDAMRVCLKRLIFQANITRKFMEGMLRSGAFSNEMERMNAGRYIEVIDERSFQWDGIGVPRWKLQMNVYW